MGTLSGDSLRLPHQCDHKLPTSCRLTSIPDCCACADERAHSPSYSIYVDGVGYVPRGTRWQRYCWFCKEFWQNRVAATNLLPTQTRIPTVPDQTEFLDKWYEFHRGYRLVTDPSGEERRIAILGEPWRDVSPGCLPRTLDELRSGVERSAADGPQTLVIPEIAATDSVSLDDALDQLLGEDDEDESESQAGRVEVPFYQTGGSGRVAGQAMRPNPALVRSTDERYRARLYRKVQALMESMTDTVGELRSMGDDIPDTVDHAVEALTVTMELLNEEVGPPNQVEQVAETPAEESTPQSLEQRLESARRAVENAQTERAAATTRLARHMSLAGRVQDMLQASQAYNSDTELSLRQTRRQFDRLRGEQRAAENFRRVFGTREDMEREDYTSPISTLFDRAWSRHDQQQSLRRRSDAPLQRDLERLRIEAHPDDRAPPMRPEPGIYQRMLPLRPITAHHASQTDHGVPPALNRSTSTGDAHRSSHRHNGSMEYVLDHGGGRYTYQMPPQNFVPTVPMYAVPPDFPLNPATDPQIRLAGQVFPEAYPDYGLRHMLNRSDASPGYRGMYPGTPRERHAHPAQLETSEPINPSLDLDDSRPEPLKEEGMTVKLECKICFTQLADTACLPCGHVVMCSWCSDQWCPSRTNDSTMPRSSRVGCPVCRQRIKKKLKLRLC